MNPPSPIKPTPRIVRVLLVDPDPWRTESLSAFLGRERYLVQIPGEDGADPEVILVNLCERAGDMRVRAEALRAQYPAARLCAFVREVETHTVFPCLLLGAKGVFAFDAKPREITAAIEAILAGSIWAPRPVLSQWVERISTLGLTGATEQTFTRSEQKVLEGIREEISNKEIAGRLGVTEATVKFHVGKLLKKTGTKDRRDLARFVRETMRSFAPPADARRATGP